MCIIDEARRDDASGQVLDRNPRIFDGKAVVVADGVHHLASLCIGPDDQQAILLIDS
jgi:hypothetical protein